MEFILWIRVAGKIVWALWFATKSRSLPWVAFLGLAANESLMRIGQKKHGSLEIDDIMSTLTSLKSVDINAL